jgi:hypothetical protein
MLLLQRLLLLRQCLSAAAFVAYCATIKSMPALLPITRCASAYTILLLPCLLPFLLQHMAALIIGI